jgi:hypothetical protein
MKYLFLLFLFKEQGASFILLLFFSDELIALEL